MRELKGEQPKAFERLKEFVDIGTGMYLLQGYAGTGKTFLMGEVVEYCKMKAISILVTAPTHKAVKVLKDKTKIAADFSTIHAALGMKEYIDDDGVLSFRSDPLLGYPAEKYDLILIDEASMIADVIFDDLVKLVAKNKKVLFVGDPLQIPPVNHDYAMPFLKKVQEEHRIGVSTMKDIIRQAVGNPIIENAHDIRTRIEEGIPILKRQAVVNLTGGISHVPMANTDFFQDNVLPLYKTSSYQRDIDYVKVIGWRNDTVNMYNHMIRHHIFGEGLPKIVVGDRLVADAPIVEDRMIHVNTNEEMIVEGVAEEVEDLGGDYILRYYKTRIKVIGRAGVFNEYMIRIIHENSEADYNRICQLQITLAKTYPRGSYQSKSAWMDYYKFIEHWHRVKYSYCVTAHKSQGSTYDTAYVLQWDIMANRDIFERNRILYTACTRPSRNLYIEY